MCLRAPEVPGCSQQLRCVQLDAMEFASDCLACPHLHLADFKHVLTKSSQSLEILLAQTSEGQRYSVRNAKRNAKNTNANRNYT